LEGKFSLLDKLRNVRGGDVWRFWASRRKGHTSKLFVIGRNIFASLAIRIKDQNESEQIMNDNAVVKLNAVGPQGQEIFLAVDFTNRTASVIIVDPRNGNIVVSDVQSIATRGN